MSSIRRLHRQIPFLLLPLLFFVLLFPGNGAPQKPGDSPPAEVQTRIRAVAGELEAALTAKDETAVYQVVKKAKEILGSYAGLPEAPEKYLTPVQPDMPDLKALTARLTGVLARSLPSLGSRNPEARENRIELRQAAYTAILGLAMAENVPAESQSFRHRATEELDYLLARQHASGMFPYPAYPGSDAPPNVRTQVERMREKFPDRVWQGYMVIEDGGGQFDTGCCAFAMIRGFEATRDLKYLEAAKRAAVWAMALPMATNWNYNAFSVWQLAALHRSTGDRQYLESALQKATIGVLPGLMENGRWVDQHNARQSYHFIMVRALSELMRTLPKIHPRYEAIRAKTTLAAEARAREILSKGPSNIESALWGLTAFLEAVGPDDVCEKAANAIVNAATANDMLNPVSTPLYLRYLKFKPDFSGPAARADASVQPTREELMRRHEAIRRNGRLITDPVERTRLTQEMEKAKALFEKGDYEGASRHLSVIEAAIQKRKELQEKRN